MLGKSKYYYLLQPHHLLIVVLISILYMHCELISKCIIVKHLSHNAIIVRG